MARNCPICTEASRHKVFTMDYQTPDNWTLPYQIAWFTCAECGMIFGDCENTQADFDRYYRERYGYGVNNPTNTERLKQDAILLLKYSPDIRVVDFGGSGDDGTSVLTETMKENGFTDARCI